MKNLMTMPALFLFFLILGIMNPLCAQNTVATFSDPTRQIELPDDQLIDLNKVSKENLDISVISTREGECDLTQSFHQNGGIAPGDFRTTAVGLSGLSIVCTFAFSNIGYARLFNLTANGVPVNSDFNITSVDYVLNRNNTLPVTVSVYSYPAGTTVPTMAAGTLLASEIMTQPTITTNTLFTHPISATVPAGEMVLVTVEAVSNAFFEGTTFAFEGGPFGSVPELAPTYVFGCPLNQVPFTDYTDVDEFFVKASVMFQLNGDTDADCDEVGDLCDLCPGGDDSGPCDAAILPSISEIPEHFQCSNNDNTVKIKVCHNGTTLCVSENAVQAHLDHGDFLGPCVSCDGTQENGTNTKETLNLVEQFELTVAPNPARDNVTIVLHSAFRTQLQIFDIYGNAIWSQDIEAGQQSLEVDISSNLFRTGIHFINASNEKGIQIKRLMIIK